MEENIKFQDAESYSSQSKDITFKQIVLQHVNSISGYASKEMRGAYYENKASKGGFITQVYVPDTREVYSNAVNYLADVLAPHFDKEMEEAEKRLEDEGKNEYNDIKDSDKNSDDLKVQKISNLRQLNKRKLFRELMRFLYRKNYLDMGMLEE